MYMNRISMFSMKGLGAFISLFFYFFCLASCHCPAGVQSGCTCSKILGDLKVECKDKTRIENIPSWIPNNTVQLEFEGCGIRLLNGDSFNNLVNLTHITVQKQIGYALVFNDSLVFQGLNRLISIVFEDIGITSLPAGLFSNLPRLKTVGLNSNPLATLPDDLLENSTNVKTIRLGNTQLKKDVIPKIGEGHFGKNIHSLQIHGTKIQALKNGLFSGLPKLRSISITNCGIEFVNADIFKATQVASVLLDGNPIKSINENAFRDSKVTSFWCKNCQLTSDIIFSGFLKKMPLARTIKLQNNNLTHIPKNAFTGLGDLSTIDLSFNLIATIEENPFASRPDCKSVNCIQLQNNPLNCDCNLAWLRSFADKIDGDKSQWECSKPLSVSGKSLVSLKVDQFCCKRGNMTKCGSEMLPTMRSVTSPTITSVTNSSDPNTGRFVSAHTVLAIMSQIVVMFAVPSLFA